jgi:hypothetical protein
MPMVIAEAFVDANSASVLALAMLSGQESRKHAAHTRLRSRIASFVRLAPAPEGGAVVHVFVIRQGDELLGWVGAQSPQDSRLIDAIRGAVEAAIGEPLHTLVRELEFGEGRYVATRVGRTSSTRACAEVAALVGVQCGWDESPVLDVIIDGERFSLRATYDGDRREWLFESASQTRDRPDH